MIYCVLFQEGIPASVRKAVWKAHQLLKAVYYSQATFDFPQQAASDNFFEIITEFKRNNKQVNTTSGFVLVNCRDIIT
jgi:hypothetical protein